MNKKSNVPGNEPTHGGSKLIAGTLRLKMKKDDASVVIPHGKASTQASGAQKARPVNK